MREKCVQLESRLAKVEKQLKDSLRREKDLAGQVQRNE